MDTWDPFKFTTYDEFRYFLTIVDDFSRTTWTYLLSTKSNIFSILQSFLSMVERQFNSKVKILRIDNAFELGIGKEQSDFFLFKEIIHQITCVYIPHNKMKQWRENINACWKLQEFYYFNFNFLIVIGENVY